MIKSKWTNAITAVVMAIVSLCTGFAMANPEALVDYSVKRSPPYVSRMDQTKILSVEIEVLESDWNTMIENATVLSEKTYIPANIIINGVKVKNVGIRPKGASSLGAAVIGGNSRFSFKIEFDHYVKGQTWLGLDKLCLNNMHADPTYMKEYFSYDIMRYIGVAHPAYSYANISVNGETFGFYLAVEAVEDSFVQRYYGNNSGELYKPDHLGNGAHMIQDVKFDIINGDLPNAVLNGQSQTRQSGLPVMNAGGANAANSLKYIDDDISSYATIFENAVFSPTETDFQRVITALENLNKGTELETYIDTDAVLRYFAAHTVVVNMDSYVSAIMHNYYLYENNGQLTIFPWDYNEAFGNFGSLTTSEIVNFPIDTPVYKDIQRLDRPLIGKLLDVPEYYERYHQYLHDIVDGYFNSGVFERTFTSIETMIDNYVKSDVRPFYSYDDYRAAFPVLKELILLRAESIENQLRGITPSTWEQQKNNPNLLVDASSINRTAIGSGGGINVIENGVNISAIPDNKKIGENDGDEPLRGVISVQPFPGILEEINEPDRYPNQDE